MEQPKPGDLWMDEPREERLVLAAQRGDRQAIRALAAHYQRHVYRLAFALTRDREEAADLAFDAFGRAWSGIKGIPSGKRFFPWVLRIARNLSVAQARRRGGGGAVPAAAEAGPRGETAVADQRMLDALRELRPDEQMALALRVVERLPYEEIAGLLDHSVGTTLARLSTARGLLLERAGVDEGADG